MRQSVLQVLGVLGSPYLMAGLAALVLVVLVAVFLSLRKRRAKRLDRVTPKLPTRQYLTGEQVLALLREWAEIKARVDSSPKPSVAPIGVRPAFPAASLPPPRLVKDSAGVPPASFAPHEPTDGERERAWNRLVQSALLAQTLKTMPPRRILISAPSLAAPEPTHAQQVEHDPENVSRLSG